MADPTILQNTAGPPVMRSVRNLVQRCFNRLNNARRVATRYEKTAESFLGFIDITSIRLWLRHLST
jgi:transposase